MRVGIITVFIDHHRKGLHHRFNPQPQVGPLIAALLPRWVEVEIINDTWTDPDWTKDYDLLFLSGLQSDFDRTRQIAHYWRQRGAKVVCGGIMATLYPELCGPYVDAVAIGDCETTVPAIFRDFCRGELKPIYQSAEYDPVTTPLPRLDLIAHHQILPITLEATRGCPFSCEFCALPGMGTRFHARPPERVVRDIQAAQSMLEGRIPWYKRRLVAFSDNNIGGNLSHLKRLCEALTPLGIRWGASATFNVVSNLDLVKAMSRSGCRYLYVGVESFNPRTIQDMRKYQNALDRTRTVLDQCQRHGILMETGMLVNPMVDDCEYIRSIPGRLRSVGFHVPTHMSFECPIPGTPLFFRLAAQPTPVMLPNALLRDFTGHTLVTRPQYAAVTEFVEVYKQTTREVFSIGPRFRKGMGDLSRLLPRGYVVPAMIDLQNTIVYRWQPRQDRTFIAGTEPAPPEVAKVPFTADDFESEQQRREIMEPWKVTDADGRVLPEWLHAHGDVTLQRRQSVAN